MRFDNIIVDNEALAAAVSRKRRKLGLSLEDMESIVSTGKKSTWSRLERQVRQKGLDIDNVLALCEWLNAPFESFLATDRRAVIHFKDADFSTKLSAILFGDKSLSRRHKEVLIDLMEAAYENKVK